MSCVAQCLVYVFVLQSWSEQAEAPYFSVELHQLPAGCSIMINAALCFAAVSRHACVKYDG